MAGTMRNPTPGEQITHFFQTRKKQILLLLLAVALMVISVLGLRGFMLTTPEERVDVLREWSGKRRVAEFSLGGRDGHVVHPHNNDPCGSHIIDTDLDIDVAVVIPAGGRILEYAASAMLIKKVRGSSLGMPDTLWKKVWSVELIHWPYPCT
eukprot:1193152-Prorocentrum_minimum.AAC.3